jgi:cation diffusion facilitator family transporter
MRRVAQVAMSINAGLVLFQLVVGWWSHSQALVADAVHSLSDLLGDGLVFFASIYGTPPADAEHPYGHARIETALTIGIALLLAFAAVGIGWNALPSLWQGNEQTLPTPGWPALAVACLAVVAKESLYHYTLGVAQRLHSSVLHASAWHHRSDAFSSVVVFLGIAGSWAGWRQLDAVAALLVAAMIAKIAWDMAWASFRELVDTGLEPRQVATIRQAILRVPGVQALHMLRTRKMGANALADVHILVPSRISVSEAHYISDQVRAAVPREVTEVHDVTVHIDPEDDEIVSPSMQLPPRKVVLAELAAVWHTLAPHGWEEAVQLHYLNGQIEVELRLPLGGLADPEALHHLQDRLRDAAGSLNCIGAVHILLYLPKL